MDDLPGPWVHLYREDLGRHVVGTRNGEPVAVMPCRMGDPTADTRAAASARLMAAAPDLLAACMAIRDALDGLHDMGWEPELDRAVTLANEAIARAT